MTKDMLKKTYAPSKEKNLVKKFFSLRKQKKIMLKEIAIPSNIVKIWKDIMSILIFIPTFKIDVKTLFI